MRVFVGNALGEFGHFIPLVIPILNAIKAKGIEVEFCGFQGYDIYLSRQFGGSPISQFYGVDWWSEPRAGFVSKNEPISCKELLKSKSGIYYWPMSIMSHADNYKFYCEHDKIVKRMTANVMSQYFKSAVIYPRCKPNSLYVDTKIWLHIIDMLKKRGYTIYMAGIQDETIPGLGSEGCTYIHKMEDPLNSHIDILNNCDFCITSIGGGVFLSLACGTPTLVIGPRRFSNIADKNYPFHSLQFNPLGTYIQYQHIEDSLGAIHIAVDLFIEENRGNRSNVKDVVELGSNELYKEHH